MYEYNKQKVRHLLTYILYESSYESLLDNANRALVKSETFNKDTPSLHLTELRLVFFVLVTIVV